MVCVLFSHFLLSLLLGGILLLLKHWNFFLVLPVSLVWLNPVVSSLHMDFSGAGEVSTILSFQSHLCHLTNRALGILVVFFSRCFVCIAFVWWKILLVLLPQLTYMLGYPKAPWVSEICLLYLFFGNLYPVVLSIVYYICNFNFSLELQIVLFSCLFNVSFSREIHSSKYDQDRILTFFPYQICIIVRSDQYSP